MASVISASTTSATALNISADTTGVLQLATGATPTTAVTIDTSQRAAFVAGTAALPAITTTGDTNTGMFFPAADTIAFAEGGTESVRIDSSGQLLMNMRGGYDANATGAITLNANAPDGTVNFKKGVVFSSDGGDNPFVWAHAGITSTGSSGFNGNLIFGTDGSGTQTSTITERMRIDSSGALFIGKTAENYATQGAVLNAQNAFYNTFTRSGGAPISINRTTNDGGLLEFHQDGNLEGTISVSGTTVSYGGGHIARWSQWHNQTNKPNVYRGTVLESTNDMCEWERNGEPLPNEQSTKTIISTTVASKAVAGVFDRYDEDDEDNPYDFYVAQSGDFVIRIAQGVVVQNGDLLESAGDGTAKPQADDICRSSTIAKVTSNYVSATYEDGSYCVPCILMIG